MWVELRDGGSVEEDRLQMRQRAVHAGYLGSIPKGIYVEESYDQVVVLKR